MAKIAVVGEYNSIVAFRIGGADIFGVNSKEEAKNTIKNLAKEYSIIMITEDFAREIEDYLKRFLESAYPIIITIPSKDGDSSYSYEKLKREMDKALGVDILFRDKKGVK